MSPVPRGTETGDRERFHFLAICPERQALKFHYDVSLARIHDTLNYILTSIGGRDLHSGGHAGKVPDGDRNERLGYRLAVADTINRPLGGDLCSRYGEHRRHKNRPSGAICRRVRRPKLRNSDDVTQAPGADADIAFGSQDLLPCRYRDLGGLRGGRVRACWRRSYFIYG